MKINQDNFFIVPDACNLLLDYYQKILIEINNNNDIEARNYLDKSRPLKNYLIKKKIIFSGNFKARDSNNYSQLNINVQIIQQIIKVEKLIYLWAKRVKDQEYKESMLTDDVFCNAFIDANIPLSWDWEKDILFIINFNQENLLKKLILRGQERLYIIDIKNKLEMSFVEHINKVYKIYVIRNIEEISSIPAKYKEFPSDNLSIIDCDDSMTKKPLDIEILSKLKKVLFALKCYQSNDELFASLWVEQGIKNLKNLTKYPNISRLSDQFKNKTCVIVGAGPSLDKNIHLLRTLKNKCIVISVAHALGALKKVNIIPDIVIHIDPLESHWTHIFDEYDFSKISLLILGATVNPKLFDINVLNKAWFFADGKYSNWTSKLFDNKFSVQNTVNVAIAALHCAISMGCKNLALIGTDFSYTNKKVYASGSENENDTGAQTGANGLELISIKGYYNKEVTTSMDFHRSLIALTLFAATKSSQNIKMYNCTEGGAYLENLIHKSFKYFIEKYVHNENSFNKSKFNISNNYNSEDKILNFKIQLSSSLEKILIDIESCLELLENETLKNSEYEKINKVILFIEELINGDILLDFIKRDIVNEVNNLNLVYSDQNLSENFFIRPYFQVALKSFKRISELLLL